MRKAFLLLLFLVISADLQAQRLVHWSDILNADISASHERMQIGPDSLQFAELWLPAEQFEAPHPVVILIHGGCWLGMYPGVALTHPMAEALANEGFAVWNIEYRRLGQDGGGYPGTFMDVANAADYLVRIADDYGLDLNNLIAAGHSAGGHLATWLAARPNISADSELYSRDPLPISRVISLAGINDLNQYAEFGSTPCGEQTVERLISYETRGDDAFTDTSPANLLPYDADHYEVVAAFDRPVPAFLGRSYSEKVNEAGGTAELVLQTEAGHYEMTAPWTEEWQDILKLFKKE